MLLFVVKIDVSFLLLISFIYIFIYLFIFFKKKKNSTLFLTCPLHHDQTLLKRGAAPAPAGDATQAHVLPNWIMQLFNNSYMSDIQIAAGSPMPEEIHGHCFVLAAFPKFRALLEQCEGSKLILVGFSASVWVEVS